MTTNPGRRRRGSRAWHAAAGIASGALLLASLVVPTTAHAQVSTPLAYTGAAEIISNQLTHTTAPPGSDLTRTGYGWEYPPAAASYLNTRQVEMHFAVRDQSHYRFDIQTVQPALEAGTRTIIVQGDEMWIYDTRTGEAVTFPVPPFNAGATQPDPASLLSYILLTGDDLRGVGPDSPVRVAPDPSSSVDAYLTALNANPPQGTTARASMIGHDSLLGRPVDVTDYGPYIGADGSSRLWIDTEHPFVLKYEKQYGQAPAGSGDMPHDVLYRVTSITFGTGPSDSDLSPSFPVPVRTFDRVPGRTDGMSNGGASPPAPFLALQTPNAAVFQSACDPWSWRQEGPAGGTQAITQVFLADHAQCGGTGGGGPYVMVRQRVQAAGLPSSLEVGSPVTINGCQIWSGTYPDSQSWAALGVGQVAIQLSSNALSAQQLTQYAGTSVCTAHEATTDPNPPGILPPTDWFCVGGSTDKPTITLYKYAQKGEQCFHDLDSAVAVLSPSVQEIIPPGASGSVNTTDCSISGNASTDPPGAVYFVRCPSQPGRGWAAGWSGSPEQITDGPNPIKPGSTRTKAKKAKKAAHKKKHTRNAHAQVASARTFVTVR